MASPQKENGYTPLAHELIEHVCQTNLNGTQMRIVLFIWRHTYGWKGQKETEMSLAKLAKGLDTTRSHVEKELNVLISRNIVTLHGTGEKRGRKLSVNKDYEQWEEQGQMKAEKAPKPATEKRKAQRKKKVYEEDNTYFKMAKYFHGLVQEVEQELGLNFQTNKSDLQKWADEFRKLVENKGVDKKLILDVMNWVRQDEFESTVVRSGPKFVKRFEDLAVKMRRDTKKKQQPAMKYGKPVPKDNRDTEIAFNKFVAEGGNPEDFNWNGDQ